MEKFELLHPLRRRRPARSRSRSRHDARVTLRASRRTRVNDFALKLANVNGTGSASANGLLMQAIFRMGIPVSGKNLFPSNIQGLPTWYEIRVNKAGHTARALDYDLMVAMNAETYARDIKEVRSGGYVLYDSTLAARRALCRATTSPSSACRSPRCATRSSTTPRERILMKNIAYVGTLVALLDIDMDVIDELLDGEVRARRRRCASRTSKALRARLRLRHRELRRARCRFRARDDGRRRRRSILIDGNTADRARLRLRRRHRRRLVPDHAGDRVMDAFTELCAEYPRRDPRDRARTTTCILQAEDELAAIGMVIGASWNGARAFTSTVGPGHLAHERAHRPRLLRRDPGGDRRRAAHRALDRHADAHAAGRHPGLRLRLARRHQAHPALPRRTRPSASTSPSRPSTWPSASRRRCFVLSRPRHRDERLGRARGSTWDDGYAPDRGRVLDAERAGEDHQVLPLPARGRGLRRRAHAAGRAQQGRVLHPRLGPQQARRLHRDPRRVPGGHRPPRARSTRRPRRTCPRRSSRRTSTRAFGIVTLGGCDLAVREALDVLARARHRRRLHARARLPLRRRGARRSSTTHEHVLRRRAEPRRAAAHRCSPSRPRSPKEKLRSVLVYGGFPLSGQARRRRRRSPSTWRS